MAFHVTARGLSTRTLPHGTRSFAIEFDFIEHQLVIRASDGATRSLPLAPRTVAAFYRDVMRTLREMSLPVKIWTVPSEVPSPIRFEEDTVHASYDADAANRFWRILVQVERVLTDTRCSSSGRAAPSISSGAAMDMAVTRFSGRPAPPREGPAFMREAYSQEVISHGFWPGSPPMLEPTFYGYAVPEPPGLKEARVEPAAAYYHKEMGEFVLPYEAVRRAADPDAAIRSFVEQHVRAGRRAGALGSSGARTAARIARRLT